MYEWKVDDEHLWKEAGCCSTELGFIHIYQLINVFSLFIAQILLFSIYERKLVPVVLSMLP